MIVGERSESIIEKNDRHIKEMNDEIQGWKAELNYAIKKDNKEYGKYCEIMIKICQNTLKQLEDECREFRVK